MRKFLTLILLTCIVTLKIVAQEIKLGAGIDYKLSKKISTEIEMEIHQLSGFNDQTATKFKGELTYKMNKKFLLSGSYKYSLISDQVGIDNKNDREIDEKNRYAINLRYKTNRFENGLRLSNKIQYQYTIMSGSKSKECLRNKIVLDYKISKFMSPYLGLEPYYNLHKTKFNRSRIYIGNELSFNKLEIDVFYIIENNFNKNKFEIEYILGAIFKLKYKK